MEMTTQLQSASHIHVHAIFMNMPPPLTVANA